MGKVWDRYETKFNQKYIYTGPPKTEPDKDVEPQKKGEPPPPSIARQLISQLGTGRGTGISMEGYTAPSEGWAQFWDKYLPKITTTHDVETGEVQQFQQFPQVEDKTARMMPSPTEYITRSPGGYSTSPGVFFKTRGELLESGTGMLAKDLQAKVDAHIDTINEIAESSGGVGEFFRGGVAANLANFIWNKGKNLSGYTESLRDDDRFVPIPEFTRGEGFLVDPTTVKMVLDALDSRESYTRKNRNLGHRLPNYLLEDILMAPVDWSHPLWGTLNAIPPVRYVTAGGRGALLAAERAKATIYKVALREATDRVPQPALAYATKMFYASTDTASAINSAPIVQRVKAYTAKPGNWATKAFTDKSTDANNLSQRGYIGMIEANSNTYATLRKLNEAGRQLEIRHAQATARWTTVLGTSTKKESNKAAAAVRNVDKLIKKNNADINKQYESIITQEQLDHVNLEAIIAATPGKNRAWAYEVKEAQDEFYKITKSAKAKNGVDVADYADALATIDHQIEIATAFPNRTIGKTGLKGLEAKWQLRTMKADFRKELGEEAFTVAQNASRVFSRKYRQLLDDDVYYGLVDAEMAATLKRQNPKYIPIRYVDQLRATTSGTAPGMRLSNVSQPLKRLHEVVEEGDMFSAREVFPQMVVQRRAMQYRNYTARAFIENIKFDARFVDDIKEVQQPTPFVAITRKLKDIREELATLESRHSVLSAQGKSELPQARGLATKIAKLKAETDSMFSRGVTEDIDVVFKATSKGAEPNQISYFHNGRQHVFKVSDDIQSIVNDLEGLPSIFTNRAIRAFGMAQAPFRTLYTAANPFFATQYLWVDSLAAMMTTGVGVRRILRVVGENLLDASRKGLGKGMSDRAIKYLESGAATTGVAGKSADDIASTFSKRPGFINGAKELYRGTFGRGLGVLEGFSGALENAPRRAVFEMELAKGTTLKNAAMAAKRSTIDFDRGGKLVSGLNPAYLFLNAGVQASVLLPRAIRRNPRLMAWNTAKFSAVTTGLFEWNTEIGPKYFGTGNYQDIPTDERYGNLSLMLPGTSTNLRTGQQDPRRIGIPLREFSILHGPLVRLLESVRGVDNVAFGEFLSTMRDELNPIGSITGSAGSKMNLVPTAAGGVIGDWIANKDSFRGEPIIPERYQNKPVSEQFDINTSEIAKKLSGGIFSPFKIDFLLRRGILKDIILGAGQVITLGETPDIAGVDDYWTKKNIYNHADELATLLAMTNPDDISRVRTDYLSKLPPELIKYKDDIAAIVDKDKDIPFVDTMVNRFLRTYGGQARRTAMGKAQDEAGIDKGDAEDYADKTRSLWRGIEQQQAVLDMQAQAQFEERDKYLKILPEYTEDDEEVGGISIATWKIGSAKLNNFGQMIKDIVGSEYGEGIPANLTAENLNKYRQEIQRIGVALGNAELRGELLYLAYRGIPVTESSPRVIDWDAHNRLQDKFLSGLTQEERDELNSQLVMRMSSVEKKQWESNQLHKSYYNLDRRYLELNPKAAQIETLIQKYRVKSGGMAIVNKLQRHPEYKKYKRIVRKARESMRMKDHYLDASLLFWGITSNTVSNKAMSEYQRMTLNNYTGLR